MADCVSVMSVPEVLELLVRDGRLEIFSFLTARDWWSMRTMNKRSCRSIQTDNRLDEFWKVLVTRRWNENFVDKVLRVIGAQSWSMAYEVMSLRHRMPRGSYTERHHAQFGHSRQDNCDVWILLGHRPNTKTQRLRGSVSDERSIELRLCVQNVYNGVQHVDICKIAVYLNTEDLKSFIRCKCLDAKVIALNGVRTSASFINDLDRPRIVALKQLEFLVVSIQVVCSSVVEHETDFLSMASHVTIEWNRPVSMEEKESVSQRVDFVGEDKVWELYMELPGNVILLRKDCEATFSRS